MARWVKLVRRGAKVAGASLDPKAREGAREKTAPQAKQGAPDTPASVDCRAPPDWCAPVQSVQA